MSQDMVHEALVWSAKDRTPEGLYKTKAVEKAVN